MATLSSEYFHASKADEPYNWTHSWVEKLHLSLKHDISSGIHLVGENLFAKRTIHHPDHSLEGYFYLSTIWENITGGKEDYCLDYDDIVEYADFFDLPMPKVFYRGVFDEQALIDIANELDKSSVEGYVLRTVDGFMQSEFTKCVAKYIVPNYLEDNSHNWFERTVRNGLLSSIIKPHCMKDYN